MTYCKINTQDGAFDAYMATPDTLPAPAIIVIQEIFGVNQEIRDRCDDYARRGFIAIAPDMFWRIEKNVDITDQTQAEWDKAFDLFNKFDADKGIEDLDAALRHVRQLKECTGKVANIGFCLGGKLSYMMATRTDVDMSISYYGVGLQDMLDEMDNIKKPTILHIAALDQFTPIEDQEKITERAKSNNHITTYHYQDCDHAFARKGGEHFDQEAADLALKRSFDMLSKM